MEESRQHKKALRNRRAAKQLHHDSWFLKHPTRAGEGIQHGSTLEKLSNPTQFSGIHKRRFQGTLELDEALGEISRDPRKAREFLGDMSQHKNTAKAADLRSEVDWRMGLREIRPKEMRWQQQKIMHSSSSTPALYNRQQHAAASSHGEHSHDSSKGLALPAI